MSACLVEEDNKKYIQVHTHTLGAQLFIMLRNVVPCCCCFFFSSRNYSEVVSQSIAVEFCQTVPLFLFIFIRTLRVSFLRPPPPTLAAADDCCCCCAVTEYVELWRMSTLE